MSAKSLMSAIIRIHPDMDAFRAEAVKGVRRATSEAGDVMENGLEQSGREAGRKAGEGVEDGVAAGAKRGAAAAGTSLRTLQANMAKTGAVATKFVTLPMLGVGTAMTVMGVKAASSFENAQIAFSTMLGSEQQATAFLADLKDFAKSTPFEFSNLVEMSQQLIAMGFAAEDVRPMLTNIGDAVAGLGGDPAKLQAVTRALGQMQAKGKVSAEEMLQLTEAGIPAWQMLSEELRMSTGRVQKEAEKGTISADKAIGIILSGMDKRFGGLMEKQAQTITGKLSNLSDIVQQTLGEAFLKNRDQITALIDKLILIAPVLIDEALPAIMQLIDAALPLLEFASDLLDKFSQLPDGLQTATIAAGFLAGPILTAGSSVLGLIGNIGTLTGALGGAGTAGAGAFAGIGTAAATAGSLIAGLAAGLAAFAGTTWLVNNTALGDVVDSVGRGIGNVLPENLQRLLVGQPMKADFGAHFYPQLADGGTVRRSGTVLVGERAPELLHLPRGAQVEPLDRARGGVTITGPVTIVANNPAELGRELDRISRRTAATVGKRRIP